MGHATYSPKAIRNLFGGNNVSHLMPFSSPATDPDSIEPINNAGRLSLSGAQPKFGMIIDSDKKLHYSTKGIHSTYILKPRPIGYHLINHDFCAANENLTMQMASQIYGIETAENGLCFFDDEQPAYLTKRFDINGMEKFAQEDFASLMGLSKDNGGSDFKYNNGSYEECADIIRQFVRASTIDILRLYRIILYNFITLNDDAHLKNFSLIKINGEYRLTPAYDLINTSLHVYEPRLFALERGLFREGMSFSDTKSISYKDFAEFGRRIGLPEKLYINELARFSAHNKLADELIDRAFLSKDLIKAYKLSMHHRQLLIKPFN